ncbi:hypothetical protein OSTOST_17495 [Ostertagia ostertagi]
MDDELALLELYMEEKAPTASCLENSLTLTMDGIERQLETAATIRSDWTHMKGDAELNFSKPPEQVIALSRILRAAESAKEKIVQLSYKYFFTRKWYERLFDPARRNSWLQMQRKTTNISEILSRSDEEIKRLGILIREIQRELTKAEGQVYNSKQYDQAETHKRMAFALHRTVQRQQDEITELKQKIGELQAIKVQYEEKLNQQQQEEKREHTEAEISDKEYFEKMIEEVNDDDERMEDVPNLEDISSDDEGDIYRNDSSDEIIRINRLQEDLWKMEEVLQKFPYRMIGDSDDAKSGKPCAFCGKINYHFSDSCPEVVDGNERYHIVNSGKLCVRCLGNCPRYKCKFQKNPRSCWYCDRIRGTIAEDLIPDDDGHHKALCSVPNSRKLLMDRITSLRREIEERRARISGRECRKFDH